MFPEQPQFQKTPRHESVDLALSTITPTDIETIRARAKEPGSESWAGLFSDLTGDSSATDIAAQLNQAAKSQNSIAPSMQSPEKGPATL
jgi:hypothetical protein